MKRLFAWGLVVLMILALIPTQALADKKEETKGELLIVADPETVYGAVDELVKVNFYLYPNLTDGRLMDTIEGRILYDPEKLTFGAINTKDEEANLKSFLEVGSTMPMTYSPEPGEIRFVYIDAYGWKNEGFWIQIVFRINQEGASAIVFNGVRYTGIRFIGEDKKEMDTASFYLDPIQVGGVATEGETVPTDAAEDVTFAPMTAVIAGTPEASTPTPKPQHPEQTVPVTTTLPTPSGLPEATTGTETFTVPPTKSSEPTKTESPATTEQPAPETQQPQDTEAPADETQQPQDSVEPSSGTETARPAETQAPETDAPKTQEATQAPSTAESSDPTDTDQPGETMDPVAENQTEGPLITSSADAEETADNSKDITVEEQTLAPETQEPQPTKATSNAALTIAVIAGIAVVILLAVLAIILILIRKKKMDAMNDDE